MRIIAIVLWVACAVDAWLVIRLTTATVTETSSGGGASTRFVGFFDGITAMGAILYGAIFALFVAGCVFWVGAELIKRPRQ